jgi:PKD repeat protein
MVASLYDYLKKEKAVYIQVKKIINDTDEHIICEVSNGGEGTYNFTVPAAALTGTTRMRIRTKYNGNDCGDPCGTTTYGEVEDYSVNVISDVDPPIADFEADNITPAPGETVYFTDLSTNNPTSWEWSFNPPTVTYVGITNSGSQNPQVQFDAAGNYTVNLIATNTGGSDTETKLNYIFVAVQNIDLEISVFLEGPFNGGSMNSDLIPILPFDQPFNVDPWYYSGAESVTAIPGTDIVDWILIELRDATAASFADATSTFDWQAAFIRNDGKIVDLTGNPALHFESTVSDSLYAVIHHRNHLSIMTAFGIEENGGVYSYDFTVADEKAYGVSAQKLIGAGIWGMYGGDSNRDGQVNASDKSPLWENESGTNGYLESDFNLDRQSDNQDKNECWLPNEGQSRQVPD